MSQKNAKSGTFWDIWDIGTSEPMFHETSNRQNVLKCVMAELVWLRRMAWRTQEMRSSWPDGPSGRWRTIERRKWCALGRGYMIRLFRRYHYVSFCAGSRFVMAHSSGNPGKDCGQFLPFNPAATKA